MPLDADYGALKTMRRSETNDIRESAASFDAQTACIGWSLGLQYFLFGCLLLFLSHKVPGECKARLHEVFLLLGIVYTILAVLGGAGAACGGAALKEFLASRAIETKYKAEHRDAEALLEGEQASGVSTRMLCLAPCVVLVAVLFLAALGLWVWGVALVLQAPAESCGNSPTAFWVSMLVACILKCCGVQCSVYWAGEAAG
mmetsp:Transcript_30450/g.61293  ORF Transcript_30450/g.61293 Transcript_30450/m.61293 type:complete len:201 (-) Transcript_30450:107-709(-)